MRRVFNSVFIIECTEHECYDNALSVCCGAEMHGDVPEFCNGCNEYSSFECSICGETANAE